MRIVLYGNGNYLTYRRYLLPENAEIIAYIDSDERKTTRNTGEYYEGIPILSPDDLNGLDYDFLFICADFGLAYTIFDGLKKYSIDPKKIRFLRREEPTLYPVGGGKWNYTVNDDWTILSSFGEIRILERGGTDNVTVSEVFGNNTYHIALKPETVVVDMGMNIGAASLYFAGQDSVSHVYAFEPFPDTFKRAMENLNLNTNEITKKISAFQVAVSDYEGEQKVSISKDGMGWRSLYDHSEKTPEVTVKCQKASVIMNKIFAENPGKRVVLKIDTEGS